MRFRFARTLLLSIVLATGLVCLSQAAEYDVNQDGTGDFTAIQDAIDASSHGDVIVVHPGTYYENIHFDGKNITLRSLDPQDEQIVASTVIDGGENGSVVTFHGTEDGTCELSGFTITNGSSDNGGGILGAVSEDPPVCTLAMISNCTITGNSVTGEHSSGGGLCGCGGTISNCTITGNSTAGKEGGGGGLNYCNGTISNCTISDNFTDDQGGGLVVCDGTISDCTITGNSASGNGGGLYDCHGTISNCTISGNSSGTYGGGLGSCSGPISNCTISGNSADHGGGLQDCCGTISKCTISSNSAAGLDGDGGGLEGCGGTISNCTISGNSADHGGGLQDCYGTISNCTISANTADGDGGGLHWCDGPISNCTISGNSASGDGGGIHCGEETSPAITRCIIWGNQAAGEEDEVYTSGSNPVITYSCIRGWTGGGEGNISDDPLFVTGPLGDYYLSCRAAGQAADSPCIDRGSGTAESLGLDKLTTRTDGVADTGRVDMAYHYPLTLEQNPYIECSLNSGEFSPGDLLVALYDIDNPGADITVDVYFAFVMPDGAILCISPARIDFGIFPCMTDVFLHQGYSMEPTSLLSLAVPGGLPVDNYLFAGALTTPGRFEFIGAPSLFPFTITE